MCLRRLASVVLAAVGSLLLSATSFAQGAAYQNHVENAIGETIAGAHVTVCLSNAHLTATPCTDPATIYSDQAETTPIANPMSTDGLGNFQFFANPGTYWIQQYDPRIVTASYPITLGNGGAGTGAGIEVNGTKTANSGNVILGNFNPAAPTPDAGFTACTWKADALNPTNIICELPNGNSAGPLAANINEVQPAPGGATTVFHTTGASDQTLQVANQITLNGKLTNLVPWQPQLALTHWSGPTIPPGAYPGVRQQEGCSVAASPNYTCTFAATSPTLPGTELIAWQYASTQNGGNPPSTFTDDAGDVFTTCTNASATFGCLQATSIGGATSFTCGVSGNVQSGAANCMVMEVTNYGGWDTASVGGSAQTGSLPETATVNITTVSAHDLLFVEAGEGSDWPCYAQKATLSGAGILFGGPNFNVSYGGLGGHGPMWAVIAAMGAGAIGTYTVKLTVDGPSQGAAGCYDGNPAHGDANPTVNVMAIKPAATPTGKDIPGFRYFTCFDWAAMDLGASDTAWLNCNVSLPPDSSIGTLTSINGTMNQIAVVNPTTAAVASLANPLIFPGKATFAASATGASSFNMPNGVAPTSPVSGDFWNLGTGQIQLFDGASTYNFARFSGAPGSGNCVETSGATGLLVDTGSPCASGSGAVSSVTGTSPIVVSPTTGATVVSCPTCSTGGPATAQQGQTQSGPIGVPDSSGSISPLFNCAGDGNHNVPVGCQSSRPLVVGEYVTIVLTGNSSSSQPNASCAVTGNNTWTRLNGSNTLSNSYVFTTTVTVAGTETLTFSNCNPGTYLMNRVKGWATYNTGAIDQSTGTADSNCTEASGSSTCSIGINATNADELHVAVPYNPTTNTYTGLSLTPSPVRVMPTDLGWDAGVFAFGNPLSNSTTVTAYATLSGSAAYDRMVILNYLPASTTYLTVTGIKASATDFTSTNALSLTSGKKYLVKVSRANSNTSQCTLNDTQTNSFALVPNTSTPAFYTFTASATGSDTITISGTLNCGSNPGALIIAVWQMNGVSSVIGSNVTDLANGLIMVSADSNSASSISISPQLPSIDSSSTTPSYMDVITSVPTPSAVSYSVTCPSCSGNETSYLYLAPSSPVTGPVEARAQACSDNAEHCTQTLPSANTTDKFDLGQYDGFSQTLGANVTSGSFINGRDGRGYSFTICQPSSGGPYTLAWPNNSVHAPVVTTGAGDCTKVGATWKASLQMMVFSGNTYGTGNSGVLTAWTSQNGLGNVPPETVGTVYSTVPVNTPGSVVQSKECNQSGGSSGFPCTLTGVSSGNSVIVFLAPQNTTSFTINNTNCGNLGSNAVTASFTNTVGGFCYYQAVSTGGDLTFTISSGLSNGATDPIIDMVEVTGVGAIDQDGGHYGATPAGASYTTTGANELIVDAGILLNGQVGTITFSPTHTSINSGNASAGSYSVGYYVAAAAGAQTPQISWTTGGNASFASVALKVATSGVPGFNQIFGAAQIIPTILYSAAGTALPTCSASIQGAEATVSDATTPTYMGAYTSGGAITTAVICSYDGSTFAWKTH